MAGWIWFFARIGAASSLTCDLTGSLLGIMAGTTQCYFWVKCDASGNEYVSWGYCYRYCLS